jgi:plasmid maintenance system antidote protein VapI
MTFAELRMRLIEIIRERVRNGELTERRLARLSGISQPHMHHILKGLRPLTPEVADALLRPLDLTVYDLLRDFPHRQSPAA